MWFFVLLLASLIYSLYYFEIYLTSEHRLLVGWGLLGILVILYRIERLRRPPLRLLFLSLGGFIAVRYILWRSFETLQYTDPLSFITMTLLYLSECYGIIIHFMGLFINSLPLEHATIPLPRDTAKYPTVDVLIPTYTEPVDIVKITAVAAKQLDYPKEKLKIYLLDDGSTIARRNNPATSQGAWERHYILRKIADRVGVNYITRENNSQAKAGNVNHGLSHTSGELILILDCDHVPTKDFLKNTVGNFLADPKLFLVQTPHFFINPTPIEKNLATVSNVSVENDMFFRIMHPGFNSWNSSYFCGSAAVLRRSHLEEVGGLSGLTITEDAETSIVLHSKGYHSVYINRPMVCGLSPETFSDYITQRTRWAQGMIQLFLLHNPLKIKGLTIPQRICYFNSCFFWFFGIPRFVYFIAPALFLILNLKVYHASMIQIIAYALPHMITTFFVMDFLYGTTRKPLFSEIYESVQSLFLLPAILSVIVNPLKPTFKITPKGQTTMTESLNPLAMPFTAVIAINALALVFAAVKFVSFPVYRDVIIITGAWCIYNSFIAVLSLGAFWEKKQVRTYHRINTTGKVDIFFPRLKLQISGEIKDLSLTGIGFEVVMPYEPKNNEAVTLMVTDSYGEKYTFSGTVPRYREVAYNKYFMGTSFPLTYEEYAKLVGFVYGDSQRWVEYWDTKAESGGTLKLLSFFFILGLRALVESTYSIGKAGFDYAKELGYASYALIKTRTNEEGPAV